MGTWSEAQIWRLCLAFRLLSALLVRTWFVPDEFWQSLEPAHRLVFGRGYLTWEWETGLRSWLFPLYFAGPWKLLKALHIDYRFIVVLLPGLQMGLLASLGDVSLYKLAKRFHGQSTAFWTLVAYLSMWFGVYCGPRTLGNSAETALLLIGLDHFPWPPALLHPTPGRKKRSGGGREWVYLASAAVATLIRPTSALMWIPLCLWHLWRVPQKLRFLFRECLPIGFPILLISLLVDRACYGRWLLSPWNFLEFNVLRGGSAHFGTHPWHWYLTSGLPSVLSLHLIPIGLGLAASAHRVPAALCALYLLVHSALAHKEQRFLLPLLPLLSLYAGEWLERIARGTGKERAELARRAASAGVDGMWASASRRLRGLLAALALVNTAVLLYTGLMHQVAPMDVTKALHAEASLFPASMSVLFLLPCHSTPFYSHVHANVPMRFLHCEPNLDGDPAYEEEAEVFHADPSGWLDSNLDNQTTHLVLYSGMFETLSPQLSSAGFRLHRRFFHAHFPISERQSRYMLLLRRDSLQ